MENFALPHLIVMTLFLSVDTKTVSSGNFLQISENNLTSTAMTPFSCTLAGMTVSIPSSVSLPVRVRLL
jgi:ABC-type sulfate transport system permease component